MTSNHLHVESSPDSGETQVDLKAGRRAFMQSVGLGMAGAAMFAPGAVTSAAAQAVNDVQILNFALNLEYLEAEFYLRAATGDGLADNEVTGQGNVGPVRGGRKVTFATRAIREYAEELAVEERAHVRFLRDALGGARVARPAIDISGSFTAAARAAGLVGPNGTFDPYADEVSFLLAAFIFEDVGVSAYLGAAPLIDSKANLAAAGGILAAEAYHAGTVRTTLFGLGQNAAVRKISDARDSLDGGSQRDQGIGGPTRGNVSAINSRTGLAFARTTRQVLNIVYLSPGGNSGGFFPRGLNGSLSA